MLFLTKVLLKRRVDLKKTKKSQITLTNDSSKMVKKKNRYRTNKKKKSIDSNAITPFNS
jgi:hypothetical protein